MTDTENLLKVKLMVEAYQRGDFDLVMGTLADDVTIRLTVGDGTPLSGTFHGKAGVGEYFARNAQTVEPIEMEVLNFLAGGAQVAVVGRETATVIRSRRVMANADWVMLCKFRDGLIGEIVIVEDTSLLHEAYCSA